MHALPCIFTLKLSHWWFVTLWIHIGLGIALYFTTRYSYAKDSKANGRQSPGRTPGWWCQCSATELQQPDNHHPHNPSISTLHSLHFTSKHLDTMHAYVFGAAVSRSAAEHNFFEESIAHGLVYANRQNYRLSPTIIRGVRCRPRSIYIAPLTATSTNGHTTRSSSAPCTRLARYIPSYSSPVIINRWCEMHLHV